jgi:uncharacterized protein YbjT (DUF2867 family)
MKKVIIIGATGSLASYVVKELQKSADVVLTLFVRNKNRLDKGTITISSIVEGYFMEYTKLKYAIDGQ